MAEIINLSSYQPEYKGQGDAIFEDAPKIITCVDCGKDVFLESYKSVRTCRCEECNKEYQLERDRKKHKNKYYRDK